MHSKLRALYSVVSISSLAGALLGVFIPVYLLSIGYSVRQVMMFFWLQTLAALVAIALTAIASRSFSLKAIMIARAPVLVVFLGLLLADRAHAVPLALLAALWGVQFVVYYLPLHVFFTNNSSEDTVGHQLGVLSALPQIVCLAAPLVAGFVAARIGYQVLFGLAAAVYLIAAIVMTALPTYKSAFTLNITEFRTLYRRYRAYFWLEIVENIQEELDLVIWPIVVYLVLHNTIQTGLASTLIAATSAAFTYLVGRLADRVDKVRLLRIGGLSMLALWLWRLLPLTAALIFVISSLVGFVTNLIDIPFDSIIYNLARANDPRHFIVFREIPVGLARLVVYTVAVATASDLTHLFYLAIGAYAIFAVLPRFQGAARTSIA